jgi:hypothetical protein
MPAGKKALWTKIYQLGLGTNGGAMSTLDDIWKSLDHVSFNSAQLI